MQGPSAFDWLMFWTLAVAVIVGLAIVVVNTLRSIR
jgi:hypothetical protein